MKYTWKYLEKIVSDYLSKLELTHPLSSSDKFVDNSFAKWACKVILNDVRNIDDIPFNMTPIEYMERFIEKMKRYSCMGSSKYSIGFVIAAETGEYILDEFRFNI